MYNNPLEDLFEQHSKKLKVYLATESTLDPYEGNKERTVLNPLPIKALIKDLTFAKVEWAMPGVVTDKAKEIFVEKKHRTLLENSYKFKVQGESDFYYGWKSNGFVQIREEGNYLRLYIHTKKN